MNKKKVELLDIIPLSGSYLKDDSTGYFDFMKHVVQFEPWFVELVDKHEKVYNNLFGSSSILETIANFIRDEERFYQEPKDFHYFKILKFAVITHVVSANPSLHFLMQKMEMDREYVLREVTKLKNRGEYCFQVYPIPKDRLAKLYRDVQSKVS